PTEGGEHPIELVEIASRYPHCVAGHAERVETTIGEGEEAITLPARAPYLGVCCTLGCRLAGPGEHIPYGTPAGYPEARAERYREAQPRVSRCPAPRAGALGSCATTAMGAAPSRTCRSPRISASPR